jgi:glycolate oxidase FAD binding subunit
MPGDNWPQPEARWYWPVDAGFEGNHNAVAWQVECLQKEFHDVGLSVCSADVGPTARNRLPVIHRDIWYCRGRANLRAGGIAEFCRLAGSIEEFTFIDAIPESGIVHFGLFDRAEWPIARATESLRLVAELAAAGLGNIVIERCPSEWKKSLPVWGRPPADLALQKAVKQALDPKDLFNPGRFVTDAF